ncbi:MAG: hypothetical protein ACQEP6_02105 [Patescibacteria group bacterium]
MAIMINCPVCKRKTLHLSHSRCLECIKRLEKEIEDEWMEKSDEEKFRYLFSQVEHLKRIINGRIS